MLSLTKTLHLGTQVCTLMILAFLTACGVNYESYSHKMEQALVYNKHLDFSKLDNTDLLVNQEAGFISFLQNDLDSSIQFFGNATSTYNELEANSKIDANQVLAASVMSDTLLPYQGADYEASLVHYYTGLAYLAQSDLSKATIEFKAVEESQKFAEQNRQSKVIASEEKVNSFMQKYNLDSPQINTVLQASRDLKSDIRKNFLNANALYVAGLVRELNKDYNAALVNYKQAYEIQPNNQYLIEDLYRLSLTYDSNFAQVLRQNHTFLSPDHVQNYNHKNTVYLIYEQGFIPKRQNWKFNLSAGDLMLSMNLPVYDNIDIANNAVTLTVPSLNASATAMEISNFFKLANNNLTETYPLLLARQAGKLVTQIASQAAMQSNSKTSPFSSILGYFYLYDCSDLRSWRTLPSSIQIAKLNIESPLNEIAISRNGVFHSLDLSLTHGEIAIVYMFDTGYHTYTKILYKGKK